MKHIICILPLVALATQASVAYSADAVATLGRTLAELRQKPEPAAQERE